MASRAIDSQKALVPVGEGHPGVRTPGLDPDLFVRRSTRHVEGLRDAEPDLVTTDGKAPRCSHDRGMGREPLHLQPV
jgi:hypothetical protein